MNIEVKVYDGCGLPMDCLVCGTSFEPSEIFYEASNGGGSPLGWLCEPCTRVPDEILRARLRERSARVRARAEQWEAAAQEEVITRPQPAEIEAMRRAAHRRCAACGEWLGLHEGYDVGGQWYGGDCAAEAALADHA